MSGVGVSGGYGPPVNTVGMTGIEYPPGPSGWTAGTDWGQMSGTVFRASDLNQQLSLPLDYLTNPPMFQGLQLTTESTSWTEAFVNSMLADPTTQPLILNSTGFDTPTVDPWGAWNQAEDNSMWWVPEGMGGMWLVSGTVPLAVPQTGLQYEVDFVNGLFSGASGQCGAMSTTSSPIMMNVLDLSIGWPEAWYGTYQIDGYQSITKNAASTITTYVQTGSGNSTPSISGSISARWVANNPVLYPLPDGYEFPLSLPDPQAWTSSTELTSDVLNSQVRDAVTFLANVPYMRASNDYDTAQSIASATSTTLSQLTPDLNGTPYGMDPWNTFDTSKSVWTAPMDGVYLCVANASFDLRAAPASAFAMYPTLRVISGGVTTAYDGAKSYGLAPGNMCIKTLRLKAGDTVIPRVYQNSGGAAKILTAVFFTLWMRP